MKTLKNWQQFGHYKTSKIRSASPHYNMSLLYSLSLNLNFVTSVATQNFTENSVVFGYLGLGRLLGDVSSGSWNEQNMTRIISYQGLKIENTWKIPVASKFSLQNVCYCFSLLKVWDLILNKPKVNSILSTAN